MTRALIFDFDGTIVDTETALYRAYAEVFEAHGQPVDHERWLAAIGGDSDFDPMRDLERALGRRVGPEWVDRRRARRDQLIDEAGVRPGVLAWLDEAEALRIPVGVASSSPPEWVERHLDRIGLRARFSCLACCDGVIPAKPDPTSYRHACEQLGADPARSIAVEDSPHGVNAAKDAGLYTVVVPHGLTVAMDLSRADLIVGSLADISLRAVLIRRDRGGAANEGAGSD